MKIKLAIMALALASVLISCKDQARDYKAGAEVLAVEGMSCSGCEAEIETAVWNVGKITWVKASVDHGEVAYLGTAKTTDVCDAIEEAACNYPGQFKVLGRAGSDKYFQGADD